MSENFMAENKRFVKRHSASEVELYDWTRVQVVNFNNKCCL